MMQGINLQHASNNRREVKSARMEHQNRHNPAGWRYNSTSTSSMTTTNYAAPSSLMTSPPFSCYSAGVASVVQTNNFSIPSFAPIPRHNSTEEDQEGNKKWFAKGAGPREDLYYPKNAGAGMIEQDDECWMPLPLPPFNTFAGTGPCTTSPADASGAGWCWDGIPKASYYKTDYSSNQYHHQYQQESSSSLPHSSSTTSRGSGLAPSEDLITSSFGGPCTVPTGAAGWDEVIPSTSSYYNKTDNSNHQYYPQYQHESLSPRRGGTGLMLEDLTSSPTIIEPIPFSDIEFPRGNDDYSDCSSNRKRHLAAFTFEAEETNDMILPRTSAVLPTKTTFSNDSAGARTAWVQTNSRPTKSSKFKRTGTISSGATMFDENHKPSVAVSLSAKSEVAACFSPKSGIKTALLGQEHQRMSPPQLLQKACPLSFFLEDFLESHEMDDMEIGLASAVEMSFVASQAPSSATDRETINEPLVPVPTVSGTIAVEEESHDETSLSTDPKPIIVLKRDELKNACTRYHQHHCTPQLISSSPIRKKSTVANIKVTSRTATTSVVGSAACIAKSNVTSRTPTTSVVSSADCNATREKRGYNDVSVAMCGRLGTLVVDSDRKEATGFSFAVLKQLERCSFDENDKRGKRTKIPAMGFPGMACIHCKGASSAVKPKAMHGRTGRYFPTTLKTLSDSKKSLDAMYGHMLKCKHCPTAVKEELTKLQTTHAAERKLKIHGSQKRFFSNIWNGLHGSANDSDKNTDFGVTV